MEDNEWSFCSMWADYIRIDCAEVLINVNLDGDYFFNRSRLVSFKGYCNDDIAIKQAAEIFWSRGLDCYIYGMDGALSESKDLSHIDTMYVLQRSEDIAETTTTNITTFVAPTAESLLTSWIDIFCSAFSVPDWKAEA